MCGINGKGTSRMLGKGKERVKNEIRMGKRPGTFEFFFSGGADPRGLTDYISLGVITEKIPKAKVVQVLKETGRTSIRERELPAHVMVYYVIALALYMRSSYREVLRCLRDGLEWLFGEEVTGKPAVKSALTL